MARVLVIGSANMDVVAPMARLPLPGETILVEDVFLACGGKGANAAVAAARLGAEVTFVGCIGADPFGAEIRQSLGREGINCDHLGTGSRGTGAAVVLLNRETAQNSIMVGPGANHEVQVPDDAVFQWAQILLLQLETTLELNIAAALRARKAGVPVILDPAPAVTDLPRELLHYADIVSPNESELAALTGRPVCSLDDAMDAGRTLLADMSGQLIVKLGPNGALWMTADICEHFPAVPVEVVDTTAAGDVFTGAVAVALANGRDVPSAIREGCLAGALTCTRLGAQPSIPTRQQLAKWRDGHRFLDK